MRTYYPPLEPYINYQLAVDALHVLYVEECGNPNGLPILFIHGGPGAGCSPEHRRFFNPHHYRIILFDQRGSGRSTPHAELRQNTTPDLINDIETIRQHLQIEKWVIFGGSWGSTLGLIYAETHSEKVLGLILRGIFLCRQQDIDWFYQKGANYIFPEYWSDYLAPVPTEQQHDLVKAYYQLLTSQDKEIALNAAKSWSVWEGRCSTLLINEHIVHDFADPYFALSFARIECHYFINHIFLAENYIIQNANCLHNIPGIIIHGRYDIVCPFNNAWTLHQAWPTAELKIIANAGHAASEPGIFDALITATDDMALKFKENYL